MKIAVIIPHKPFFGALLVQMPLYQHLRANYPDAHICLWAAFSSANIFKAHGLADEVRIYNKKKKLNPLSDINSYEPDILIDLWYLSERMTLMSKLVRAKHKISLSQTAATLGRNIKGIAPFHITRYIAFNYLSVLDHLPDCTQRFGFDRLHEIKLEGEEELPASDRLPANTPFVTLMPGGGEGPHKRWSIENYCALARHIHQEHAAVQFLIVLGVKEQEYEPIIRQELGDIPYRIAMMPTLSQLTHYLQHTCLTVANDCGPSHWGQMLGGNYIGVWGWKEEENPCVRIAQWAWLKENSWTVVASQEKRDINSISPQKVALLANGILGVDAY